jgi:hypothetical protein
MGLLPSRVELVVFAIMAVACAVVVAIAPSRDYAMMFATMPLFAIAIAMGGRRRALARRRAR